MLSKKELFTYIDTLMGYNPLLLVDSYKIHHYPMYPENMTKLYSNGTCRKSRLPGIDHVVVFGIQHFVLTYLIKAFNEDFFGYNVSINHVSDAKYRPPTIKDRVIREYSRHCQVDTKHIEALWDLGYLPIELKALEEGTLCPIGVPMLTITNTHPDFGWLVNYLETLISCSLWQPYTSATLAWEFKKLLTKHAIKTTGTSEFVQWQGHDFSMRGMSSVESAILSGMGHLLSFTGTDTIPAIYQLESSYDATGLIGASVPATEHSVMCMGTKEAEIETFKRLLMLYPSGILSVVSDTWNLWEVVRPGGYCEQLKQEIMSRDGKLVIRPDSGDPVDIICGSLLKIEPDDQVGMESAVIGIIKRELISYGDWGTLLVSDGIKVYTVDYNIVQDDGLDVEISSWAESDAPLTPADKGVIELLWEVFGGTVNEQGYKVLDPHIGAIYGDSINLERAEQICERLAAKGFASTNVVLGIGSYTYQYNTRDTFGFAMKATYGEITHEKMSGKSIEPREIFKDPITDDGTKKSKKGLLKVISQVIVGEFATKEDWIPEIVVYDQQTWAEEATGLLTTVFKDGVLTRRTTLDEIRERLNKNLQSK